jgi:RNA polymerase sigma-70 factor (ECF subfamily)
LGSADTGKNQDDFDLMRRIAERDCDAIAALYERYARLVFSLGLRMLRDRGDAEDFLTDIFWEVWNRADRYNASRGAPVTYLMTLARSRAIDRQRSAGNRGKALLDSGDPPTDASVPAGKGDDPAESAQLEERRKIMRAALGRLDAAQREAIEMSFYDGMSHSEIAAKLSKPLGTIKTYIRQGIIRLRESLRNE